MSGEKNTSKKWKMTVLRKLLIYVNHTKISNIQNSNSLYRVRGEPDDDSMQTGWCLHTNNICTVLI